MPSSQMDHISSNIGDSSTIHEIQPLHSRHIPSETITDPVEDTVKEPCVQDLYQSLDEVLAHTTPPPPLPLIIVRDFAYGNQHNKPSRATGTIVAKSTFLEGTSRMPMMGSGGLSRGVVGRMRSLPLRFGRKCELRRKSWGL